MRELKIIFRFNGQKCVKFEKVPENKYLEVANTYERDVNVDKILIRRV